MFGEIELTIIKTTFFLGYSQEEKEQKTKIVHINDTIISH